MILRNVRLPSLVQTRMQLYGLLPEDISFWISCLMASLSVETLVSMTKQSDIPACSCSKPSNLLSPNTALNPYADKKNIHIKYMFQELSTMYLILQCKITKFDLLIIHKRCKIQKLETSSTTNMRKLQSVFFATYDTLLNIILK